MLSSLRPEKGAVQKSLEEMLQLRDSVLGELGPEHWASAAMDIVVSYRHRAATGGIISSMLVAFEGLHFLGWLLRRNLPLAPARILRTPLSLAVDVAHFCGNLGGDLEGKAVAGLDGRSIAARLTKDFILPVLAGSCGDPALAGLQTFWQKVGAISALTECLKSQCAACKRVLGKDRKAMACGQCKQLLYCSKECQANDWKQRHKKGCLPASESLGSDKCRRLFCS